MSKISHILLSL